MDELASLAFTATATDGDVVGGTADTLEFSLGAGAPTGASINSGHRSVLVDYHSESAGRHARHNHTSTRTATAGSDSEAVTVTVSRGERRIPC